MNNTEVCAKCHVSRDCIEEMMQSGSWEDECAANALIDSCHQCRVWWSRQPYLAPTRRLYTSPAEALR